MICSACAAAADKRRAARTVCSVCKSPRRVYNDARDPAEQSVVVHKVGWERCLGSTEPPLILTGHDVCNGCSCQHRERGSWRGRTPDMS